MVGEDRVIMSVKELRRVHVIRQTMEKKLTQVKAGTLLGLTPRHIRRLIERVEQEGDHGLAHRGRGMPSNRRLPAKVKAKALKLYAQRYGDFGPTLAAEKLAECHGVPISDETLRQWLRARGIAHFTRRKRPHRAWRARKAHVGELVQLDGSHHDWFEGRGPRCVLMAYIDDASSRVCARFYEYEGTIPAMDSFQRYVQRYGIPLAIYADKHSTYQSPAPPTVDEQLAGVTPTSQFGRALGELGVELIPAHSPQAKGRVERLFKTFQDRVIKEMRLADVSTLEAANQFLEGYLPLYNRRFAVPPAQAADLHRPLSHPTGARSASCASKRNASYGVIGRWPTTGTSIRCRPMSGRPTCWSKSAWMGRCGSRTRTGRSPIRSSPRVARRARRAAQDPSTLARPVTPTRAHPWRKRLLPERGTHAAAAIT